MSYKHVFMERYGCELHEFFSQTEYADVADLILAQAAFESGWGRARWVEKTNQVFAMQDKNAVKTGDKQRSHELLMSHDTFRQALEHQLSFYQRRGYSPDREKFILALDRYCPKVTCGVQDYPEKIVAAESTVKKQRELSCRYDASR